MPRVLLRLEYDGTDFQGWQAQAPGARTVQGTLEAAATAVLGVPTPVRGAGRTDAGVHAEGQAAALDLAPERGERLGPDGLRKALNARLPEDLAVLAVEPVADDFDPQRHARSKTYRYDVWNGGPAPLRRRRWHFVPGPLDPAAMARAARAFEGPHDFAALRSVGSSVRTTERTLLRCALDAADGEVRLTVEGTGFLRHMVRTLAGTLIEVGQGRRPADGMAALLAGRDRAAAGPTAPARGLTLVRVDYPAQAPCPAGGPSDVSIGKPRG